MNSQHKIKTPVSTPKENTSLAAVCTTAIEVLVLGLVVIAPLWMLTSTAQMFELEKIALIRFFALFMTALFMILHLEKRCWPDLSRPLVRPVLLYFATYTLATLVSKTPQASFWGSYFRSQGWITTACYLSIFLITSKIFRTNEKIRRLLMTAALGSLPVVLYAFLQHQGLDPLTWQDMAYGTRVFSTLGQPNLLGTYLAILIPTSCALVWLSQEPWQKAVFSLLAIVQSVILLWTGSRGALVGLLAGLVMLLILATQTSRQRLLLFMTTATLTAAFLLAVTVPSSLHTYLERTLRLSSPSADNRVYFLQGAIRGIEDRPLLGHGSESMYSTFPLYYDARIALVDGVDSMPDRTHNELADIAYTTGILGLLAYLFLLVRAGRHLILLRTSSTTGQPLLIGLASALGAYLVSVQFSFGTSVSYLLFWLLLGLISSLASRSDLTQNAVRSHPTSSSPVRYFAYIVLVLITLAVCIRIAVLPILADSKAKTAIDHEKQDEQEQAAELWHQAWSLAPEQPRYAYQTIMAHIRSAAQAGQKDPALEISKARNVLKSIAEHEPLDSQYYRILALLSAAEATFSIDPAAALNDAAEAYNQALALAPQRSELHDELGLIYLQQGKLSEAEAEFQRALDLFPSPAHTAYVKYLTHLAGVALSRGQNRDVIDLLSPFAERADAPDQTHLFLAYAYLSENDPAAAIVQARQLPSDLLPGQIILLKAYSDTGDQDNILTTAQALLKLDPANADALAALDRI